VPTHPPGTAHGATALYDTPDDEPPQLSSGEAFTNPTKIYREFLSSTPHYSL